MSYDQVNKGHLTLLMIQLKVSHYPTRFIACKVYGAEVLQNPFSQSTMLKIQKGKSQKKPWTYYKVLQKLQSVTIITNCESTPLNVAKTNLGK